jgi:hypothetical protein
MTEAIQELRRPENVVLQQLEQDNMASENDGVHGAAPGRGPIKDPRLPTPSPPSGPPILGDGLESPRSNDC